MSAFVFDDMTILNYFKKIITIQDIEWAFQGNLVIHFIQ